MRIATNSTCASSPSAPCWELAPPWACGAAEDHQRTPRQNRIDRETQKEKPRRSGVFLREEQAWFQRTDSTHSRSLFFGKAPILVAATWPSLNSIRVGIPRTPYFFGVCGFSSMLSLAIVIRPESVPAISSSAG